MPSENRCDRLVSIIHDIAGIAVLGQHFGGDDLIHPIVLGNENSNRGRTIHHLAWRAADDRHPLRGSPRGLRCRANCVHNGIVETGLANRFEEMI